MELTRRPRYEVEIEELVLGGVSHAEADLIRVTFQRELTRLLTVRPPRVSTDRGVAVLGELPALPPDSPRRIGQALARTVHTGLAEVLDQPVPDVPEEGP